MNEQHGDVCLGFLGMAHQFYFSYFYGTRDFTLCQMLWSSFKGNRGKHIETETLLNGIHLLLCLRLTGVLLRGYMWLYIP